MAEHTDTIRPEFHITGKRGWINDPNGLIKFKGEYHVFFQYYSSSVNWGPMHWGHVKSKDLLSWQRLPVALSPDSQDDGCFSGTAIVWKGRLWLMYTSFKENGGGENIRQLQAVASSFDGVHFEKHGIVIGEKDLPDEYSPCDFRDPKIFAHGKELYCLVAARRKDGRGRILLFSSDDMFRWKFVRDILKEDSDGIMIECPDYSKKLGLLTYCEQFQPPQGEKHLNIHSTFYRAGNLNKGFGESEIIDYGFDFYAAQIFKETPVMIGWLNMWDRNIPYGKYGFAGMLTLPRKICVKKGRLFQKPLFKGRRVKDLRAREVYDNASTGVIEISVRNLKSLRLELRKKDGMQTVITADKAQLTFDRSMSGEPIVGKETDALSLAGLRKLPLDSRQKHTVTVVTDLFSVEIFVDGKALSSAVCPDPDADGIVLHCNADSCRYVRYDLSDYMKITD